jgi:hypothetical protein
MSEEVELKVPGRLCLLGEHSDWAGGQYRRCVLNKIKSASTRSIIVEAKLFVVAGDCLAPFRASANSGNTPVAHPRWHMENHLGCTLTCFVVVL